MELNPYAPTTTTELGPSVSISDDAELVRRTHLSHEANIQGIGGLYLLGGIFGLIIFTLFTLFLVVGIAGGLGQARPSATELLTLAVIGILGVGMALIQGYAGWSMRKLNPKGKPFAILVTCFGLLGFPLGTLISVWILWMLLSEKGTMVFSPEYRAVIEATPHIRYKTSIIAWVFLGVILLLIVGGIAAAILGS